MEKLPAYISIIFELTVLLTLLLFWKATKNSIISLLIILLWLIVQAVIGLNNFYLITSTIPPRFFLLVLPPIFFIAILFFSKKGKRYIDEFDIKYLTLLHVIRIPVELVLYGLFMNNVIPKLMTFEGRNFDILSGLTAPLIFYFGFIKKQISRKILLFWNFICLLLLLNIVVNAILSAPFPFQKFAFNQPNIAILYFPFILLPGCIVPLVLFSHLATIKHLLKAGLK